MVYDKFTTNQNLFRDKNLRQMAVVRIELNVIFLFDLGELPPRSFSVPSERSLEMNNKEVPVWEKSNLTLEEAASYYGR